MSCTKDKWFDAKQNLTQVIPQKVSDFQALMDNVVLDYNAPYLAEIASDGHYVTDAVFNSLTPVEKNAYTWSHTNPYTNVPDWGGSRDGSYTRVYYANLTLDGLKTATGTGTFDFNNVMGQALFYRAKNFYELLQVFAPVYDSSKAATDLGIPLRLESDINIPSKRATVKESYEQVIADVKAAVPLLPVTPQYKTRPSKPACYALLARLYLSVSDYADAGKYADSCLHLYTALLNYNTLNLALTYPLVNYNDDVIMQSTLSVGNGAVSYNAKVDMTLYQQYDPNDLRKVVLFTPATDGTVGVRSSNFYNTPFNGLTPEEMYLIRAESSARLGQKDAAMADINTLLRTRYKTGTYIDQTAATADDALVIVLLERRKELVFSGLRWSDLRRFGREGRFAVTLTRTVAGTTYTLDPKSFKYTFPIPDDVINQAPQLQQNPGW
jgi:hypothetical protein